MVVVVDGEEQKRGGFSLSLVPAHHEQRVVRVRYRYMRPFPEMRLGSRVDTVDLGLAA